MKSKSILVVFMVVTLGKSLFAADGDLIVNGNIGVGMGTSTPTEKVHVNGNAFITGDTYIYGKPGNYQFGSIHYGYFGKIGQPAAYSWNPDNGRAGLWIEGTNDSESGGIFLNGNTMVLWSPGDNDILKIIDEDYIYPPSNMPSPLFVVDGVGNVGIRMTKPGYYYNFALNVGGSAYATGYWQSSDIKLKENIQRIESPLNKVLNMEGVSFTWKQESEEVKDIPGMRPEDQKKLNEKREKRKELKDSRFPKGNHYGVIAQDMEKVMPEIVKEGPDSEKAVNYSALIPVLIEAVKEQQKIIEKQTNDIKELRAKMATVYQKQK